eukprot:8992053-Karenia_brevis.AAC.1
MCIRDSPFKFQAQYKSISHIQDTSCGHKYGGSHNNGVREQSWQSKLEKENESKIIAYDDVTGAPLKADKVKQAREEEI